MSIIHALKKVDLKVDAWWSIGLIVFFGLLPVSRFANSWHDQYRFAELLLFIIGALYVARYELPTFSRAILGVAAATVFASLISIALSAYPVWALVEFATLFGLLACVLATRQWVMLVGADRALRWVLWFVAASVFFFLLPRLFVFGLAIGLGGQGGAVRDSLAAGFDNVRFLGQYQLFSFPLLAACVLETRRKLLRLAIFVLTLLWIWVAVFFDSRGVMLGLIGQIAVLYGLRFQNIRSIAHVMLGALIGAFLVDEVLRLLPVFHEFLSDPELYDLKHLHGRFSDSGRFALWQAAWHAMLENPIFGLGPMHYAAVKSTSAAHPHNSVLQLLSEWGVVASFGYLYLACCALRRAWQNVLACNGDAKLVVVFCAFIAMCGLSLLDGVFVMPYSQLAVAVLFGCLLGARVHTGDNLELACFSNSVSIGLKSLIVLVVLGLLCFACLDYQNVAERAGHYEYLRPRFWISGVIP